MTFIDRSIGTWVVRAALLTGLLVPAVAAAQSVTPLPQQPAASDMSPGLNVAYYYGMYKYVDQVDMAAAKSPGSAGAPLPQLNAKMATSPKGEVFDSHAVEGVGLKISGMIHFDNPGEWKFVVLSNDGVRVSIADQKILEDPDVHSDRLTDPVAVAVPSAGWYKFDVSYFQRHASWALVLSWKPPGAGDFVPVPADAFAHLNKQGGKS
ncbi:MAG TPA: PA14 domain-containing protein [Candidatus Cybelea sp.]|nr:PA14 domain-containing protein [Candidatus Cybelea sp.]